MLSTSDSDSEQLIERNASNLYSPPIFFTCTVYSLQFTGESATDSRFILDSQLLLLHVSK